MRVIEGFFSVPNPILSITYRRAIQARKRVAEALSLAVRERRMERERGIKKNDMLAALFDSNGDGSGISFSDDEIVDFLVSLLVAGYDTTSTTITLAVKFLTDTPSALAQLKNIQLGIPDTRGKPEKPMDNINRTGFPAGGGGGFEYKECYGSERECEENREKEVHFVVSFCAYFLSSHMSHLRDDR
nr:steroid 23-alpha-hydroxylase cytochrome P450 [Tanacetum cinerariifolium]